MKSSSKISALLPLCCTRAIANDEHRDIVGEQLRLVEPFQDDSATLIRIIFHLLPKQKVHNILRMIPTCKQLLTQVGFVVDSWIQIRVQFVIHILRVNFQLTGCFCQNESKSRKQFTVSRYWAKYTSVCLIHLTCSVSFFFHNVTGIRRCEQIQSIEDSRPQCSFFFEKSCSTALAQSAAIQH